MAHARIRAGTLLLALEMSDRAAGLRKRLSNRGRFSHEVALVAGSTAIGQFFVVLSSPLLSRQYSPAEFGIFAVFTSVLSLLAVAATGRYEFAIPLPRDEESADHLVWLSLGITLCLSAALAVLIGALHFVPSLGLPGLEPIRGLLYLMPIGVAGAGVFQTFRASASRRCRFKDVGYATVGQSASRAVLQVILGALRTGEIGLVAGYVASSFVGIFSLARSTAPQRPSSIRPLRQAAALYSAFPKFNLPAALVTTAGLSIPTILLTIFFGADTAGHFSLSVRILALPVALIGQSVYQVFYPRAAAAEYKADADSMFTEKLAVTLIFLSVPLFTLCALFARQAFQWVFGPNWGTAGEYSQVLAPMYAVTFIASPLAGVALIKGRQRTAFVVTVVEFSARVGAILVGSAFASAYLAITLYSLVGVAIGTCYAGWMLHLSGIRFLALATRLRAYFLSLLGMAGLLLGLRRSPLSGPALLIVSVVTVTAHFAWTWRYYGPRYSLPMTRQAT